jgi:hypothetical protein
MLTADALAGTSPPSASAIDTCAATLLGNSGASGANPSTISSSIQI